MEKDEYLKSVLQFELQVLQSLFPDNSTLILDVGAGTGWQAKLLADAGYKVCALDIALRDPAEMDNPVEIYDGLKFPYPAEKFDVVLSSNCLDHVKDTVQFFFEVRRVLTKIWTLTCSLAVHGVGLLDIAILLSKASCTRLGEIKIAQSRLGQSR